jgi:hypothetical protein
MSGTGKCVVSGTIAVEAAQRPRRPITTSVNDILTIVVALAAVAVSAVALLISNAVDKRTTRSALTDLAVKIGKKAAAYEQQGTEIEADRTNGQFVQSKADDHFVRMKEIEMLAGQADFLVDRIEPGLFARRIPALARKPRYPASVAITFAQALEAVQDSWWADRYWNKGLKTDDEHFRAWTYTYWGIALCDRGEHQRGRRMTYAGYDVITSQEAAGRIFRGDLCAEMIDHDSDRAGCWRHAALAEYSQVEEDDELYAVAQSRIELYGPWSCLVAATGRGSPDDRPCCQLTRVVAEAAHLPGGRHVGQVGTG